MTNEKKILNLIYEIKNLYCNQCQAQQITFYNIDGTPFLHCLNCLHDEIIPRFNTKEQEKQFILNHIEINLI